VKELSNCTFE